MTYPTNATADVLRLAENAPNKSQYGVTPVYSGLAVLITPAGPDIQMVYPNVSAFALFDVFVYDTTYQLGNSDKLVIEGREYLIKGVPQYYVAVGISYIRLVCERVL